MERFKFEIAVDLEGNGHIGRVLITDIKTGEKLQSNVIEARSRAELMVEAKLYKERFLLNAEVLGC